MWQPANSLRFLVPASEPSLVFEEVLKATGTLHPRVFDVNLGTLPPRQVHHRESSGFVEVFA